MEFYDGDWKIIIKSDDNKIKSTNAEKIKFLKDDSNENLNNNENVYSFIDLTTECKDSKFESIVDLIKKEFKSC